ncbi:uncharacterized protein LOC127878479 [Dreissena polymorpha]|nr:uncharacterized protein LOC127878479 [Dreissena polymorpha]
MDEFGMTEEEELLIDSLFYKCDSHNEGLVGVSAVIQYLKSCQNQCNDEPGLLSLAQELETVGMNGKVSLASYRSVLKRWIRDVKGRRDSTSFLDPDGALQQQIDMDNVSNNNAELSSYIETSAVGESQGSACDCEVGELLQELGDLRFQNRRLQEENTKFQKQMDSQDELLALRLKEDEALRKRFKSVQESLDLRHSVIEENEELKSRLLALQEEISLRDSRIQGLEKDISSLESQASAFEAKWQKVTADLEAAEMELQLKENTCLQQQHKLLDEQELKSSHADLLNEKLQALNALQQKCNQLMEQNEKLQYEKEDVQGTLAELNGKFIRLQSQTEQFGICSGSLLDEPEVVDAGSRLLPRIPFSTPLHRHSICMELKDKLGEDKHLPSPLCEKQEVTRNPREVTHNPLEVPLCSVLLPPYMSAWNVDSFGSSLNDYSLELNRRSLSPEPKDLYLESGFNYLKDMENDALQREVIKLYRLNVDLAEKCHKAELKEAELLEQLKDVQSRYKEEETRNQEYFQKIGEEHAGDLLQGQLRDLWRLVHHPEEDHSSQSSNTSLPVSTDALKHQIFFEISALREKLITRDAAWQSLSHQLWRTARKGRSSSSTLVDALNIDHVRITRKPPFTTKPDRTHQLHKSLPLCRKSDPVSSGCSESHQYEWCYEDIDEGDITTEDMYCRRFDVPRRFKGDGNGDNNNSVNKIDKRPFEGASGRTDVSSADIKEPEQLRKSETNQLDSPQTVLRRQSYSNAVLNKEHNEIDQDEDQSSKCSKNDKSLIPVDSTSDASSADTTKTVDFCSLPHRGRSGSFKAAIEQGPVTSIGLNNACSVLGDSQMTPDFESNDSLSISSAPKYSSTPLPSFLKSYPCVEKTVKELKPENVECSIDTNVLATDLFKIGSISLSRLSQGTSNNLSVLPEEDGSSNRPMPSQDISYAGCSVDVWSITPSDLESRGSCTGSSTRDSGHSSTIESFDRDNNKDFADGSADDIQGDLKSSLHAVERVPEVCVVHQSALVQHKQPSPIYVGDSVVADEESVDCTDGSCNSTSSIVQRDKDTCSQDQQHQVPEKNKQVQQSAGNLNNGNVGSSRSPQLLLCSEDVDQSKEMQDPVCFRSASMLSKIRESHLAKRREITRQTQMPQLSELAEKDVSEKNDELMETRQYFLVKDEAVRPDEPSTERIIMPSIPDEYLLRLGLVPDSISCEELSDQEVEVRLCCYDKYNI